VISDPWCSLKQLTTDSIGKNEPLIFRQWLEKFQRGSSMGPAPRTDSELRENRSGLTTKGGSSVVLQRNMYPCERDFMLRSRW